MTETKKPHKNYKSRGVDIACWKNVDTDGNIRYNYTVTKSYKDKDDTWKKGSIFREDLLTIAALCQEAFTDSRQSNFDDELPKD